MSFRFMGGEIDYFGGAEFDAISLWVLKKLFFLLYSIGEIGFKDHVMQLI